MCACHLFGFLKKIMGKYHGALMCLWYHFFKKNLKKWRYFKVNEFGEYNLKWLEVEGMPLAALSESSRYYLL